MIATCRALILVFALSAALWSQQPGAASDAANLVSQLPLSFIPNRGQWPKAVSFESRGLTGSVAMLPGGVSLTLPIIDPNAPPSKTPTAAERAAPGSLSVAVQYRGADPEADLESADPRPGTVNYFKGNRPEDWVRDVPTYGGVIYRGLYPGIDLLYNGREGRLKGTFTVAPGVDPAQIRWEYRGINTVDLDEATGDLVLGLPDDRAGVRGKLRELAPVAWQDIDGQRFDVPVKFRLLPDRSVVFDLAGYDVTQPLVIDPTVVWATNMGGNGTDHCISVCLSASGDVYVAGRSHSNPAVTAGLGWPVTPGAFDTTYNGEVADAYVMKISEDGQSLIYSSYLGGGDPSNFFVFGGADWGLDIDVGPRGEAYVVGWTEASNFPVTTDAIQPARNGTNIDGFFTIISPNGDGIEYSTYLGGTDHDYLTSVELDERRHVMIGGYSQSTDYPTTVGAYQTAFGGGLQDMVFTKFTPDLHDIAYSTFVGWTGIDQCFDLHVGPPGSKLVYLAGNSDSVQNFSMYGNLADVTVVQPTNGGTSDAILVVLRPRGLGAEDLVYATYLGGMGPDNCLGLDVGPMGDAYMTGLSGSANFPLKLSNNPISGGGDAWVARIRPSGQGLNDLFFSTIIGGAGYDLGWDVSVYQDEVFVTGLITGTFGADPYILKLDNFGGIQSIVGFGGPYFEMGMAIDVNATGIVISGYSQCQGPTLNFVNCASVFPWVNAYQPYYGGGSGDGFIAKYEH
ncbi:MAG: hypothetical protein KDB53_17100 [Planctomycetes bacterium]|nr:hypothetical protein [Planctomycetota bacterium]